MLKNLHLPANSRLDNFSQMTLKKLGMPPEERDHVLKGVGGVSALATPYEPTLEKQQEADGQTDNQ